MFVQIETLRFTPGRRQEGLDRMTWMHDLMRQHDGFQDALIAKYLGDATHFLVLRTWTDAAAQHAFHAFYMEKHASGRPIGLYSIEENTPWDRYHERDDAGSNHGPFLVKTHRRVPEAAWHDYTAFQQEVEQASFADGGPRHQLRRLKAFDGTDVLNVNRYASRDDFDRFFESSPYFDLTNRWPEGIELVTTQCFEIVGETGPRDS